jgi:hypothetical protein
MKPEASPRGRELRHIGCERSTTSKDSYRRTILDKRVFKKPPQKHRGCPGSHEISAGIGFASPGAIHHEFEVSYIAEHK